MAPECGRCGYSYRREPGFYLGSIYINYGVTAICTILLYALMVMGLGASHERALTVSVVVAVVLPVLFFRWARALLLALDNSVNANQSHGTAMTADAGAGTDAGLNLQQLTDLKADDGNAGCVMGVALALILLFGLLMAGVTLSFVMSQPALDSTGWESERSPEPKRGISARPMPHFPTGVHTRDVIGFFCGASEIPAVVQEQPLAYTSPAMADEWLKVGGKIGVEIGIGHQMGQLHDEPVLILKSAIGNRSLGWDLLPPGSPSYEFTDPKDGKTYVYAGYGQSPDRWEKGTEKEIIAAKFAFSDPAKHPELKGDVATVYTHPLSMGSSSNAHYGGNAKTYMNVGQAMGQAMVDLMKK